jgi:hypothetical protein
MHANGRLPSRQGSSGGAEDSLRTGATGSRPGSSSGIATLRVASHAVIGDLR